VILITGASAGIGRACADRMHAQGWKVIGASRRGTSSGGWVPMVMDVDSDSSVATGMSDLLSEHNRLDAVVNGVLIVMVTLVLVESARQWIGILSGAREMRVRESPFVRTRFVQEQG